MSGVGGWVGRSCSDCAVDSEPTAPNLTAVPAVCAQKLLDKFRDNFRRRRERFIYL